MSGVILLPTLNRTELLRNFIKSYEETKAEVPVKVLVDDQDFLANEQKYLHIFKEAPPTIHPVKTGLAVSMGEKTRFIWPQIESETEGFDYVGLLNDDHYCITPEWDKKVEALLDCTNMVSTNDGYWNFGVRVVGLTAWSTELLTACGFPIFPAGIDHLYIDDVWKAIGESTGCWQETMTVNIEHRHVLCGKQQADETFRKVNSQADYETGLKAFQNFMEKDFKVVCERITKLRTSETFKNKFV